MNYLEANNVLGSSLSPNRYCICKKTALQNNADPTPFNTGGTFASWTDNRLVVVQSIDIQKYTITWNFGGNGTADKVVANVPYGTPIASSAAGKPADPTWIGYTFDGWYIENTLLTNQTVSGDITVTAHWTQSSYTITWNPDGGTWPDSSTGNKTQTGLTLGSNIVDPGNPEKIDPDDQVIYLFSGFSSNKPERSGQKFNPAKHKVIGDETWTATYGEEIKPKGGKAQTMDNMGQVENTSKGPSDLPAAFHPNGTKVHWWSGPMDGHSNDEGGSDNGISADQSNLGRHAVVSDNVTFYHYDGDTCVYEYQVTDPTDPTEMAIINALPHSESAVTTLLTSWSSPNGRFTIESLNPNWIRFAVTYQQQTFTSYTDPSVSSDYWYYILDANGNQTTFVTYLVIEYYIADNTTTGSKGRAGSIKVTTSANGASDNNECTITMTNYRADRSDPTTGMHEAGQVYFDEYETVFYQRGPAT